MMLPATFSLFKSAWMFAIHLPFQIQGVMKHHISTVVNMPFFIG